MTEDHTNSTVEMIRKKSVKSEKHEIIKLQNVELENIEGEDVLIENVVFDNLAATELNLKGAKLKNVVFNNCVMFRVYMDYSTLENVTFNNCKLKSFNPQAAENKNVTYVNSQITSASFLLSKGDISIEKSTLSDIRLNKADVSWTITNSTLEKIEGFSIHGSIKLTDSTLKDANFDFGEMDSFEAYNSKIEALGPGTIKNKLIIKGGEAHWTGLMNVGDAHLDGVKLGRFAITDGNIGHAVIENCRNADLLGFSKSNIGTLVIRNCDVGKLRGHVTDADFLELDNVTLGGLVLAEANIKHWKMQSVELNGELDFELANIHEKSFSNLKISPKAAINTRNTRFIFP